jgi:hypothetical protein
MQNRNRAYESQNNVYDLVEQMLSSSQLGDIASDHQAEINGFTGFNYVCIQAVARQAARAMVYAYDDSADPEAAIKRKHLRKKYGADWRNKAVAREHQGVVLESSHTLMKLLNNPNPYQTGSAFRSAQIQQLRLHGSCLTFNRPNVLGTRTVERYVIPMALCYPIRPGSQRDMPNGGIRVLPNSNRSMFAIGSDLFEPVQRIANWELPVEMLSIARYEHPYFRGDGASPTSVASKWIDTATKIDDVRWEFHNEGPNGRLILTCDSEDPAFLKQMQDQLNDRLGPNGPEIVVIGKGTEIATKRTFEELGINESHEAMRDAIMALHGVSKAFLAIAESTTYSSHAASVNASIMMSVQPDMDLIADEDTLDLGPQYGQNIAVEYEVPTIIDLELEDRRLQMDVTNQATTYGEYRMSRGMQPFGNALDDMIMTPAGPVSMEKFINGTSKPAAPAIPAMPSFSFASAPKVTKSIVVDEAMLDDSEEVIGTLRKCGFTVAGLFDADIPDDAFVWDASVGLDLVSLVKELPDSQEKDALAEAVEASQPKAYKYGCVMLPLPSELSKKFIEMANAIPDEMLAAGGRETEPHITLLYGITGIDAGSVVDAVRRLDSPTVTFGNQTVFPEGKDGVPVKIDVDSPALSAMNESLKAALPHIVTHPIYNAHATIAYVKPEFAELFDNKPSVVTRLTTTLSRALVSVPGSEKVIVPLRRAYPAAERPVPALALAEPAKLEAKRLNGRLNGHAHT